jgi:NADPH-dependent curcumin reductase CurA
MVAMTDEISQRVLLVRRPQGEVRPDDFRFETGRAPEPDDGQVLVRTIWLSLDPYMRGRMNEGPSYVAPVPLGGVMQGECVGEVVASRHPDFRRGDFVRGHGGWQSHFVLPAAKLTRLDPEEAPLSTALGILGMPGLTAYAALRTISEPKPGETLVVAAASGAVGTVAGQLAQIAGCRIVGIAGGREKCRYVLDELDFDACLDHREPDLSGRLAAACPNGVDIYVELVGGEVLRAVLPLMNVHGRISVIGTIAWYNLNEPPPGPDRTPQLMRAILTKRLRVQGFIVYDQDRLEPDFRREVAAHLRSGRLKYREDIVQGLECAPEALIGLLAGKNFGKLLVQVSPDPTR